MTNRQCCFWGLTLLGISAPLFAQRVSIDAALRDKSYVEAAGEATISAKPDQAVIDFGVATQGTTAAAVASQNAKQTDAALAELRTLLGSGDQIKTTGYSVHPNYQNPKPGATQVIAGYTASNTVEIKVDDLTQVGKIVDTILQTGVNSIQRLQFGLKDMQAVQSQALHQAAVKAKANAEAIADGLGVHILRVLSAEEQGPETQPSLTYFSRVESSIAGNPPQTETVPGTVDVIATVILRAEISQ